MLFVSPRVVVNGPDGWWKDRPSAASRLGAQLRGVGRLEPPVGRRLGGRGTLEHGRRILKRRRSAACRS